MAEISKITLPSNTTYDLKDTTARTALTGSAFDSVARDMIAGGISFVVCTSAADTPQGVTWKSGTTTITGTLVASQATKAKFYLVPEGTSTPNSYAEYVTVEHTGSTTTYSWEKIGSKDIDLSNYAKKGDGITVESGQTNTNLNAGITLSSHSVTNGGNTESYLYYDSGYALSPDATFTNSSSSVTFTGGTDDTFVKSYPGVSSKLETTTVTGVSGSTSVTGVSGSTSVTGVKADTTTATKVTSYGSQAAWSGTVSNETLTISWTPNTVGSGSDVTVPIKADAATTVPVAAASATTVPVAASSATTVAKGTLSSSGTGASVMTGLGTASTASAVTAIGTGTAAAQTLSIGETGKLVHVVKELYRTGDGLRDTVLIQGTNSGVTIADHTITNQGHTHTITNMHGTIDS